MNGHDKILEKIQSIENGDIREYLQCLFFYNDDLVNRIKKAPASDINFARKGGLIEYILALSNEAVSYAGNFDNRAVNIDILKAAAMVSRLGAIYAYAFKPGKGRECADENGPPGITSKGWLIGTSALSYSLSVQAFIQAESILGREIPVSIKDNINHIILYPLRESVGNSTLECDIIHRHSDGVVVYKDNNASHTS